MIKDIRLETLNDSNYRALCRFSDQAYDRPRSPIYHEWRYLHPPRLLVVLLMRGDECVASVSAFLRRYRFPDTECDCLEPAEWWCDPAYRGQGLGRMALQYLMDQGQPIVNLGGTRDSMSLIPRLGWVLLDHGKEMVLPLNRAGLGKLGRYPLLGPLAGLGLGIWHAVYYRPRLEHRSGPGEVYLTSRFDPALLSLYEEESVYRWGPIPEPAYYDWMTRGYPPSGAFIFFHFVAGERLRGWGLGRVCRTAEGTDARIIDLYYPGKDMGLLSWMAAKMVSALAGFRPNTIRAVTTSPFLQKALKGLSFVTRWSPELYFRPASGHPAPEGPTYLGMSRADDFMACFPTQSDIASGGFSTGGDRRDLHPNGGKSDESVRI